MLLLVPPPFKNWDAKYMSTSYFVNCSYIAWQPKMVAVLTWITWCHDPGLEGVMSLQSVFFRCSVPDFIALYVRWCSTGGNLSSCTFVVELLRFLPMMCSSFDISSLSLSKMSFGYFLKGANTKTASVSSSCIFYFLIECSVTLSWQQIPFFFSSIGLKTHSVDLLVINYYMCIWFIVFWLSLYSVMFLWIYRMYWK